MNEITWAPLIPLIGGQMLGAEKAFGKPPEAIYSFAGFEANDSHYVNYQQNVKGRDIKYVDLTEAKPGRQIDVISGTPPCAALSQLNTGTSAESKGAGCAKNEWMYEVFTRGIDDFNAKAVVVENAPALFTNKGKPVADALYQICKERGYSLSLYKTSTKYHGIPQARDRTFAIGWKSETAPIMNWYKRDRKTFLEHLNEIPEGTLQQDLIIHPKLAEEPYFQYIQSTTNQDARQVMIDAGRITAFNYIMKNGLLDDALDWFEKTGNEKGVKLATHAKNKFAMNKGIWDGSVHVFNEVMNAVIGRNMNDTIHPKEMRSLTIREALHMMGFPHDFELVGGLPKANHIAQNVPVPTSRDIHTEIGKFIRGELNFSEGNYLRQNNHKELTEYDSCGNINISTLEEFLA